MIKNYTLLLAVFLLIAVAACKKDKSEDESTTNMDLITSASWKFDKAQIDSDADGSPDSPLPPGILQSCDTDNIITLKSDGTGTVDEGAAKCDGADPQTVNITWEFANQAQTIVNLPDTIYGEITGNADVKILTETKMQLAKDVKPDGFPFSIKVFVDFIH